jgi:RNA polymerase sigma factor (sigma-70 family)
VSDADADVVRNVRRGDREAFGDLVRRYQGRLFGLALVMVRERGGAEEVTQDAFVRAYTCLAQYDETRPFYPWLATIAVRLSQNWLRRHGRQVRREGTSLDDAQEPSATDDSTFGPLLADERGARLWQAVASLPSGQRTALVLHYRDAQPVAEIARALGVTAGTIKTLLFRARRRLRERLDAAFADPRELP